MLSAWRSSSAPVMQQPMKRGEAGRRESRVEAGEQVSLPHARAAAPSGSRAQPAAPNATRERKG